MDPSSQVAEPPGKLGWFSIGTPQSDEVRIVERFTLSADQARLDVEMTVVDPATFTAPAVLRTYWQAYAGKISPYDCQAGTQRVP